MGSLNCSSDIKGTQSNRKQKQQCVSNRKNRKKSLLDWWGSRWFASFLLHQPWLSLFADQMFYFSSLWSVHWGNLSTEALEWLNGFYAMPCHGSTTPWQCWNCSCGRSEAKLHLLVLLLHRVGSLRKDLCVCVVMSKHSPPGHLHFLPTLTWMSWEIILNK